MQLLSEINLISPNFHILSSIHLLSSEQDDTQHSTGKSTFPTKPLRIYFADDDKDDRELFKEALDNTELSVKLDLFNDGKDLIEKFKENKSLPDLIVLDLNMPNKNGIDCLNYIRKNKRLKNIPVAIYSTSSSPKDIDETFAKGANLFVSKPSSFNELIELIRELILIDWKHHQPNASLKKFIFSLKNVK